MEIVDVLVFRSRADPSLSDTELELLLLETGALNRMRGVTGVVLKSDHHLVQYLEGPPASLSRCFVSVSQAVAHRDIEILHRVHGVARHFDDWHMGFCTFQRPHGRSDANEIWLQLIPLARSAARHHSALAVLVRAWDDMCAVLLANPSHTTRQ